MPASLSSDVIVVGGGVIGLSVAYELAQRDLSVTILERGEPGREASWAGAGILPPASWYVDDPALDVLTQAASPMHRELSQQLREETGLDDEYWDCGALYQRTEENAPYVEQTLQRWSSLGVACQARPDGDFWVPAEAQTRNPRRLQALLAACQRRGVRVVPGTPVERFQRSSPDRIDAVYAGSEYYTAGQYCLAAGCWTPQVAHAAGAHAPGNPVRGQMLLLRPRGETIATIVHRYPYYAAPRRDGRVLVGATVEQAGFDQRTTAEGRVELRAAAAAIDPRLGDAPVEAHWAGLRPASQDRLPQIGPLPGIANAWVAAGHHRSGLQLAPPTAKIIASLLLQLDCDFPTDVFNPSRVKSVVAF